MTAISNNKVIRPAKINAIFAVERSGGISYHEKLPWPKNSEDLRYFQKLTQDSIVLMGRSTWDSPDVVQVRPFKSRYNVVVTNHPIENHRPTATTTTLGVSMAMDYVISTSGSLDVIVDFILNRHRYSNLWIIGGANILYQSAHFIEQVYLTRYDADFPCDKFIELDRILGPNNRDFKLVDTTFPNTDDYTLRNEIWKRK